jgi:hypothetical protein
MMAELPLEYHAISAAQQVLKIGARRDVAFVLTRLADDRAVKEDEKKVEKIAEKVAQRKKEKVDEKVEDKWRKMEVEREVQLPTAEREAVQLTTAKLEAAELTKVELAAAEQLTEMELCIEAVRLTGAEEDAVIKARRRKVNVKARLMATDKHVHAHCKTCTNGPRGKIGCRMCVPYGHDIKRARCLQLRVPEPGRVPETELRPPPPSEANGTVEYRRKHCYADGALHPSTADDPEAVRRSDDERML